MEIFCLLAHTILTSIGKTALDTSLTRSLVPTCQMCSLTGIARSPGLLSSRPMRILGVILLFDFAGASCAILGRCVLLSHVLVVVFFDRMVCIVVLMLILRHGI